MPTLNWIGKDAVVNHHHQVPFRTLKKKYTFGDADSDNMIIHGDNLEALKALLPKYEGRIKCIYIDPPYNTGAKPGEGGWVYYDNVDSPKIRKWLGQVVGPEFEDLSRHDKWLCMMYPRLKLLQRLLSEDGAIFISIDDNEQANLKLICDEIFGIGNFVELFSWRKTYNPSNLSHSTKKCVEYVYCYAKSKASLARFKGLNKTCASNDNPLIKSNNQLGVLVFPKEKVKSTLKKDCYFPAGKYGTKVNVVYLKNDVEFKNGNYLQDIELEAKFIWTQEMLDSEISNNTQIIFKGGSFAPRYDRVEYNPEVPRNLIDNEDMVGTTEAGGKILLSIFGEKVFTYPKVPSLIEYIINFLCDENDIILDSFAGSGTTAHAVLNLNKRDGGNRKFILVEMEDYADNLTAERVRRVIKGCGKGKKVVKGTGGGFTYYELGETVFNADGYLNESVGVEKIREYIWYSETHVPYSGGVSQQYLLGNHNGTAYYFYYEPNHITTLNHDTLNIVREKAETYVIYADQCMIDDEWLTANHIIFKKIPRDINRF
ncbi:MAG: site-specific DNA-methyltransferase [Salinivirgaceae bacterium]|nr:site-specific DNA-methyltransferase [Salinivirgaceae bacterium]